MATKINYGMKSVEETFCSSATVGDLLANRNILGYLGASEDVQAVSGGSVLGRDLYLCDHPVITLEKKGSEKA